jgi:hypothetical protein
MLTAFPKKTPLSFTYRRTLGIELAFVIFLFYHTFWHLIYFERNSYLVFGSFLLLGTVFLYSFFRHVPTWKLSGLKGENFGPSVKEAVIPIVGLFCISLVLCWVKGVSPAKMDLREIPDFLVWAFVQQWLIQNYFLFRYEAVFQNRAITVFLTALTFSLIHIPNTSLIIGTFIGGLYFCYLFLKWRNLYTVATAHALASLILVFMLKPAHVISSNYRVGPDPLPWMRGVIEAHLTPETILLQYDPSMVPNIIKDLYETQLVKAKWFDRFGSVLASESFVLGIISERDFETFQQSEFKESEIYVWFKSNMWLRKFDGQTQKTLHASLTFDLKELDRLYREKMILISNKPFPLD